MGFFKCPENVIRIHMGIDFRSADIAVSQKLLDRAQLSSVLKQMGCKAVPQGMDFGIKLILA